MTSKKIILLIVGIIIVCLFIVTVVINNNFNNNEKNEKNMDNSDMIITQKVNDVIVNTSSKISSKKTIDNIEINNAQLTNKDGVTKFIASVKNIGNNKIDMLEVDVILLDNAGKEIKKLSGIIGTIKAGEEGQLNIAVNNNYIENVYDYNLVIKK